MNIDLPPRGILYYPTIHVPTGQWLRQSLLYWDEIGSIVPRELDKKIGYFTPDIDFLLHERVYKAFDPHVALEEVENKSPLAEELFETLSAAPFQMNLPPPQRREFNNIIFSEKIALPVFEYLNSMGLAKRVKARHYYLFEQNTYHLYMALLAKYVCMNSHYEGMLIPGTDVIEYEKMVFETANPKRGVPSFSLQLTKLLPTPAENTPLDDILDFKHRRNDELLRFRLILSELQSKIQTCESELEIKETLMNFQERIVVDLSDLRDALKADKLNLVWSTLVTILTFQFGDVIKQAFGQVNIPLPTFLGGLTVGNIMTKANWLHRAAGNSPVSYLLHAIDEFS